LYIGKYLNHIITLTNAAMHFKYIIICSHIHPHIASCDWNIWPYFVFIELMI
jgi:hypothetical protein